MKKIFLLFISAAFCASCSTLSKKECQEMNWEGVGETDGANGGKPDGFQKYQYLCRKHQVTVDSEAYQKGWQKGIKSFCTYQGGYQLGSQGRPYENVCPKELEKDFNSGLRAGYQYYQIQQQKEAAHQNRVRMFKQSHLGFMGRECVTDSDCGNSTCSFNKCSGDGRSCTFDSDCGIQKHCVSNSQWIDSEFVSVRSCR